MFLPWKLIFQKTNFKKLILITIGFLIVAVSINLVNPSCRLQQILILNEIALYEKSLEPKFCEVIVEKIVLFNNTCESKIEILDCS